MERSFTIGELASESQVSIGVLRYYDRSGLLDRFKVEGERRRQYPKASLERVRFIQHARELGFTLNEVRDLLALRADGTATCSDVRNRVHLKIADIDDRLERLQRVRTVLLRLSAACRTHAPMDECPVLDALDHGSALLS